MGLLDRFRKADSAEPGGRTITPRQDLRRTQLMQLEGAVSDVLAAMDSASAFRHPGWPPLVEEYTALIAEIRELRSRDATWEELVDVSFQVRPVVRGTPPDGLADLVAAQERMLMVAKALGTLRPDEIA